MHAFYIYSISVIIVIYLHAEKTGYVGYCMLESHERGRVSKTVVLEETKDGRCKHEQVFTHVQRQSEGSRRKELKNQSRRRQSPVSKLMIFSLLVMITAFILATPFSLLLTIPAYILADRVSVACMVHV